MYQEFANARTAEIRIAVAESKHRMEWAQFTRIDRLENALRVARRRVHLPANHVLKTNN